MKIRIIVLLATLLFPAFVQSAEKAGSLDRNKTHLVNCAAGVRSATACKKLETMGFKKLYDLGPGFDGWKQAGKPIEK